MYGTDVTLSYPGFDTFVQQCRPVKLESEDTTFVTKFSIEVVWRGSNESNPDQTALSGACSDFAQVWRCSNESNYNQTTLTAACSDCALV